MVGRVLYMQQRHHCEECFCALYRPSTLIVTDKCLYWQLYQNKRILALITIVTTDLIVILLCCYCKIDSLNGGEAGM